MKSTIKTAAKLQKN